MATAAAGVSLETVRAEIDAVLLDVATSGPTPAEMTRGRAQAEAGFVQRLQTIGGFSGKSDQLNAYNVFLGDPGAFGRDLARYRTATADSVRAAAASRVASARVALCIVPRGRRELGLADMVEATAS